jgi:copper chaperone CopZ
MKNLIVFAIAFLAGVSLQGQTDAVSVQVKGLGCPYCAAGLEKKLNKIEGIKDLKIELKSATAVFTVPSAVNIDEAAVRQKVEDAGYTAEAITILRNKTVADLPKPPKKKNKGNDH